MRIFGVQLICFLIPFLSFAQRILPQQWVNQNNIRDQQIGTGDGARLYGLNSASQEFQKGYCWENDFQEARIWFYPKTMKLKDGKSILLDSLSEIKARINIWTDELELESGTEVKVISNAFVSNILFRKSNGSVEQFINPIEFKVSNLKGMLKLIIGKEDKSILKSKEILVQRATYNAAMQTGNKDAELDSKDHYYIWNGMSLIEIEGKKGAENLLNQEGKDGKVYFKSSGNKLKSDLDYHKFGDYLFD